ncbi:50S ribosomal protein L31e [uncultured archaeon]|nr:50S ribosomal protein L31e [uncultured archaeon]
MAEETKPASSKKLERIYTVPFGKAYEYLRTRRTRRAMKMLRAFLARHCKVDEDIIRISAGVNDAMWRDGMQKPPRRLKVRAVLEDGRLTAWMVGEQEAVKKAADEKKAAEEKRKKAAEAKKAAEKKEAPKAEEKKADADKPAPKAESKPSAPAAKAEPKAGDVKPMPKSSGGMSGGRKQI